MCGRYASSRSPQQLAAHFDALFDPRANYESLEPNYNVAPTDPIAIVRESHRDGGLQRVLSLARWGLVPSWAKDVKVGSRMFNARAEEADAKPAFRKAFHQRRCLVPADGWYEWATPEGDGRKQPFFMTPRDGDLLAFAGLWEVWHAPGESAPVFSASVLTVPAFGEFATVHDRMPLVLPADRWAGWLGERADVKPSQIIADITAAPTERDLESELEIRPVGVAVGDVRNNGPQLVKRAEPVQPQKLF